MSFAGTRHGSAGSQVRSCVTLTAKNYCILVPAGKGKERDLAGNYLTVFTLTFIIELSLNHFVSVLKKEIFWYE